MTADVYWSSASGHAYHQNTSHWGSLLKVPPHLNRLLMRPNLQGMPLMGIHYPNHSNSLPAPPRKAFSRSRLSNKYIILNCREATPKKFKKISGIEKSVLFTTVNDKYYYSNIRSILKVSNNGSCILPFLTRCPCSVSIAVIKHRPAGTRGRRSLSDSHIQSIIKGN